MRIIINESFLKNPPKNPNIGNLFQKEGGGGAYLFHMTLGMKER